MYNDPSSVIGSELSIFWIIPFIGILLSIAILPLIVPVFWQRNYGKISAFWALLFLLPFTLLKGIEIALYHFLHVLFIDYLPFIILLFSSIFFLIYVTVQACSRSFSSLSLKSSSFNYSCSQLKAYGLNFTSHSELSSCSIDSKASLSSMISLIIGQRSYSSSFNNYSETIRDQ